MQVTKGLAKGVHELMQVAQRTYESFEGERCAGNEFTRVAVYPCDSLL
jgi:hypothetical protein